MLSVLLYGSECWVSFKKHLNKLNCFHHRCFKTTVLLKCSNDKNVTLAVAREQWGDKETKETKLKYRHLECLGHLSRMPDYRFPKICLFGWLSHSHSFCGPRR